MMLHTELEALLLEHEGNPMAMTEALRTYRRKHMMSEQELQTYLLLRILMQLESQQTGFHLAVPHYDPNIMQQ